MRTHSLVLYCVGSFTILWIPSELATGIVASGVLLLAAWRYRQFPLVRNLSALALGMLVTSVHFCVYSAQRVNRVLVSEIHACVISAVKQEPDLLSFVVLERNRQGLLPRRRFHVKWFIEFARNGDAPSNLPSGFVADPSTLQVAVASRIAALQDSAVGGAMPVTTKPTPNLKDQSRLARHGLEDGSSERLFQTNSATTNPPHALLATTENVTDLLSPGSCWRLWLKIKPVRAAANEVGFNYERWLFSKKVHGLASVRKSPAPTYLGQHPWIGRWRGFRSDINLQLAALTHGHVSAPLVSALAVGVRDGLQQTHWQILRRTGTAHLMAISGLHVGLAAMLGFLFGRYVPILWRHGLNLHDRGAVVAILFALVYASLAGFAIATTRAIVMLLIWYGLRLLRKNTGSLTSLLLAVTAILTIDPFAWASNGFWLSCGAVLIIILACQTGKSYVEQSESFSLASARMQVPGGVKLLALIRMQISLTLFLMPFSALVSGGFSWLSVPINIVLIPIFSVAIVPLILFLLIALITSHSLAVVLANVISYLLDYLWTLLAKLAALPVAYSEFTSVNFALTMPLALMGLVILLPASWPAKRLAPLLVLPLIFNSPDRPKNGEYWLDVLDVGQALAVVIQTHSATILYDTGNRWRSGDSGQQLIVPLLKSRRIDRVDHLVISHADSDHAGGALSLQAALPISRSWVGESVEGLLGADFCLNGIQWQLDGVKFEFLHPDRVAQFDGNEQSCVLLISAKNAAVLLTGDLGALLERRLIGRLKGTAVDVVIGAHHGSLSSSDSRFVSQVRARYVVLSSGYKNQWGMPREQIVQRWQRAGTTVLQSSLEGQIGFVASEDEGLYLNFTQRQRQIGRWHWSATER